MQSIDYRNVLYAGFCDELLKIAETKKVEDVSDVKNKLRPGDILYTQPREIKKLYHKAFYALESRIQGSPYTHVGLYAGDGKVIDAGDWTKGQDSSMAVHEVPIKKFTDRYKYKVLRVNATSKDKKDAVEYARRQIGKDFNIKGMLRLVLPFKGKASTNREQKDAAESFFCSELVANAYGGLGIAKNKELHHIMPGDIYKSTLTKTVAEIK